MAENWASRLNPVTRVRERWDGFRAHPVQNLLSMLLGAGASVVGGPAAGMAANRGSRELFGKWNDRAFNQDSSQLLSDTRNNLDRQIWGGTPQMTANPISYGGMSGITSPQRGSYPTPQGPQQSALASMLGLNNYQGNSPGSGLPGITSPNPYSNGDNGGAGQNTSPAQMLRPIGSAPPPNQISGGGARDAFAGTSGSSDWGNTFASLGMQGSSGGSHNSMAGPTAIADSLAGQSALRNRLREQLRQNPNDQSALALREQMIANRGGSR